MASVSLKNITKIYAGNIPAVAPTSVEIADGEFVVLVGPSGCGKSTLLRMIAGLESITAGELLIDDKVVNNTPAKDRDIAMVFQNYALYPHLSVRDNMGFGLKMRKFPKAEIVRRVSEAAEILGLTDYLERKPGALSGGQRQRVAVGRAIVRQPKLFLFDEPLSNLDAKLRVSTRTELIKLHKSLRATIIYVTHDQTEAMSMGDRLIVLKNGNVQQTGTPLEIYHHPANQFVAGFIGSPPMNFFECEIIRRDGETILRHDKLELRVSEKQTLLLQNYKNEKVIFGIRPEDIHEKQISKSVAQQSAENSVVAQVQFVEALGNEVLATCALGGTDFIARLSATTVARTDASLELAFNTERAVFFEVENGAALN